MCITVNNLTKTFRVQIKEPGIKGQLKAIFKKEYKHIKAVQNISFEIKRGESVAFIGPNGAGKSTTIKMLTGILHPTSGNIKIIGLNPVKERQKLSFKLGSIFGQKTQLWYHLPARDTYDLLASIFEIDLNTYKKRLNKLIDLFEIQEYIDSPVRKLSLGQRMKCELVAALLHEPDILLLDEPTIGLDMIAKKQLRKIIVELNKKMNKTILLTSHDLSDIENVCNRVIIINHGKIIFDGSIEELKRNHIKKKRVKIIYEDKSSNKIKINGTKLVSNGDFSSTYELNLKKIKVKEFIELIVKKQKSIIDITISDIAIEEIIEDFYRRPEK